MNHQVVLTQFENSVINKVLVKATNTPDVKCRTCSVSSGEQTVDYSHELRRLDITAAIQGEAANPGYVLLHDKSVGKSPSFTSSKAAYFARAILKFPMVPVVKPEKGV